MEVNKKKFEVELDGRKVSFEVRRPDPKVKQKSNLVYARTFRQLVKPEDGQAGAIVRPALESVMREQKLWDDAKQAKYEELFKELQQGSKRLQEGGFKLKEARELAINMRRWRAEMNQLMSKRNELDLNTAEAQSEQARFNYLVSACTVYEDGKPYFKNEEDYATRPDDDPVASKAASLFGQLYYGIDDDFYQKLPENAFLLKWKFCREGDLHLINEKGDLINADGKRVDEDGNLLDKDGKIVDEDGNHRNKDGTFAVEHKPFLDDNGVPVE